MFATFVSRIKQNKLFLQASNQRLYKRQLTVTLTVESMNYKASNEWLHKRRLDGYTSVDLPVAQR